MEGKEYRERLREGRALRDRGEGVEEQVREEGED